MKIISKIASALALLFCFGPLNASAAQIIDIRPITQTPNGGNTFGLAYNTDLDTLIFSQNILNPATNLTEEVRINTIDMSGNLLSAWDLLDLLPGTVAAQYIQYNPTSGNLQFGIGGAAGGAGIYETSSNGETLFGKIFNVPGKIIYGDVWNTIFPADEVRHYGPSGTTLIDTLNVSMFVNGISGPYDIAASLTGGLFVGDLYGSALFEMDTAGNGSRYIPLNSFGTYSRAMPLGIAADTLNGRIFVEIEGDFIVALDANDLNSLATSFPTPPPPSLIPLPPAVWLLGSGLFLLAGFAKKSKA